ncbi:MAG: hypothetical protein JOZ52_07195 [Acidobacteria bacterium]|nr:hypothetical protein [Acidobacteriota bacterium]
MSTDTQKYSEEFDREPRHSALEEFSRDERRPAVLLLAGLIIAAIFFALGIMVGRWTSKPAPTPAASNANQQRQNAPVNRSTPATASPSPSPASSATAPSSTARPLAQPSASR